MATDKITNTPYSMNQVVQEVLGHLVYDEIGTIKQWAFNTIPAGHLEFNGAILLKADYSELYQKALNNGMVGIGLFFEEIDSTSFKIADCSDEIFRNYGSTSGRYDKTSFNANTTSGSTIITGLGYTSFMFIGMSISGAGIPAGATITSIDSTTQVTLSANATATATSYLTFIGRKLGTVELGQIENITGEASCAPGAPSGVFSQTGYTGALANGAYNAYFAKFDASKVVKAGPETRMVNRSVKYIIKAKNIVGIDPTVHQANANFLDGLTGSAYAKVLGNPSNAFQVANGVNSNEAVNLGQFACLKANKGYQKFPSGIIMQWGYDIFPTIAGYGTNILFPIAFPTVCVSVTGTANSLNSGYPDIFDVNTISASGFYGLTSQYNAGIANGYASWMAIGY